MSFNRENFQLRKHCHINSNDDGDRFVGIKADSSNALIYFPIGYSLPKSDDELRRDVKNLFQVLAVFTNKDDRVLHVDKFTTPQSVDFPIQAYLNVINYYLDHNGSYYTEPEVNYKNSNRGKTNWSRTIKTQTPMIYQKSLIFLDRVVRVSTPDLNKLITKIHKYCVYESFERIGWLYSSNRPEQPDLILDKVRFLSVLNSKLANTNNENNKKLFRSMIAMIEYIDHKTIDKQFYFGTDNFETVWEKLIDKFFGAKNKAEFFPHGIWNEKRGPNKGKKSSALEPDSIMIYKDKYYVLDAKYYRYGVSPQYGIHALPQSSDINKQITYGEFVNNKLKSKNKVFNAFIMPFNRYDNSFGISNWCGNIAEATGDWIENPKSFEKIQGVVIDTRYLLKNYDGTHDIDKKILGEIIEE